jgi:hypothetical protein
LVLGFVSKMRSRHPQDSRWVGSQFRGGPAFRMATVPRTAPFAFAHPKSARYSGPHVSLATATNETHPWWGEEGDAKLSTRGTCRLPAIPQRASAPCSGRNQKREPPLLELRLRLRTECQSFVGSFLGRGRGGGQNVQPRPVLPPDSPPPGRPSPSTHSLASCPFPSSVIATRARSGHTLASDGQTVNRPPPDYFRHSEKTPHSELLPLRSFVTRDVHQQDPTQSRHVIDLITRSLTHPFFSPLGANKSSLASPRHTRTMEGRCLVLPFVVGGSGATKGAF